MWPNVTAPEATPDVAECDRSRGDPGCGRMCPPQGAGDPLGGPPAGGGRAAGFPRGDGGSAAARRPLPPTRPGRGDRNVRLGLDGGVGGGVDDQSSSLLRCS
eukprot:1006571-Pyramimonas_sp.AAC.1